jgi:hypothetical protein
MFMMANVVQAATEFEDNVPIDLAKIFVNIGNVPDVGIYSDIMEDFPEFAIPAGFSVLGSLDQGVMQRVVLRTELGREEAGTVLFEALAEEGWQELQQPGMAAEQPRGFVPAGGRQSYGIALNLCHDEHGNMSLSILDADDGNLASLMRTNNRRFGGMQPDCEQQAQQMGQGLGIRGIMMAGGVSEHMPTLQMPDDSGGTGIPSMGFFTGGGGSTNDWETRGNLSIDWAIDTLYDHFAEQLGEQGWTQDSAWTGSITAGGNWTKSPEDDLDLIAILSIVETAEEAFELKLRILSRGSQSAGRIGIVDVISP